MKLLQTIKNKLPQPPQQDGTGRQLKKERRGLQPVLAVLALVASFGFWVYVRSVVTPYTTVTVRHIPVEFTGEEELREDRNLMLDVVTNSMADLTIYGKRSELSALNRDNITLTVDLSGIKQADRFELPYHIAYDDSLSTSSLNVTAQDPAYVSFSVANLSTKSVQVKGTLSGDAPVAEGYLAGTMTFEPEQVVIKGPEEIVDQVEYALVALERENLSATVTAQLPYTLIGADSQIIETSELTCDVTDIAITQPIVMTKDVDLTVEYIAGGGALEKNVSATIEPKTITLAGDPTELAGVNQITLGSLDLSEIIGSYTTELPILIPNNTENLSGEETAQVTVELKGLSTKVYRVTNIELTAPEGGYPEGMKATCLTSSLQVYVRAPEDIIEQIFASNIRAVADLTDYTAPGQYTVPVEVFIDGNTDAGVLNEYEVSIRVEQIDAYPLTETPLPAEEAPVSEAMVKAVAGAQQSGMETAFWGAAP